jgi:hypothetical protein
VTPTPALRLLYAQTLARTGAGRLAMKEIQEAQQAGADASAALEAIDILATEDHHSATSLLARARLRGLGAASDVATAAFKQVLETDPSRAEKLRGEIEAACQTVAEWSARTLARRSVTQARAAARSGRERCGACATRAQVPGNVSSTTFPARSPASTASRRRCSWCSSNRRCRRITIASTRSPSPTTCHLPEPARTSSRSS